MFKMTKEKIEQLKGIIEFYKNAVSETENVKQILQNFDGKQLNKKFYDVLDGAYPWKNNKMLRIEFSSYSPSDTDFCLRFTYVKNRNIFINLVNYVIYKEDKPKFLQIIGKTERLYVTPLLQNIDEQKEYNIDKIEYLEKYVSNIDKNIALYNEKVKELNQVMDMIPIEVADICRYNFDSIHSRINR